MICIAMLTQVSGNEGVNEADLAPATTLIARMEKWIALQGKLLDTIEKFDDFPKAEWVDKSSGSAVESEAAKEMRKALQSVLDEADELEAAHLEVCGQARDAFNALDLNYRQHIDITNLDDSEEEEEDDEGDYDEEEQEARAAEVAAKRDAKMNKAKGQQYKWQNYKRIRSPEDFARGVLLSKSRTKVNQKSWQKGVINRSMLVTDSKDIMKTSQRIHKSILGYCGDKSMAFPGMLANDILNKGLKRPALVDEIYVQICKQLTNNPKKESEYRGWQLLCMCVGCFPPTREFEHYLLNFILAHESDKGTTGNYANYALRRLEGILESGASGFVPSVDEITAYKERPPILATIELVDGTPLTQDLPVTPDLDVSKVLEICVHFLELEVRALLLLFVHFFCLVCVLCFFSSTIFCGLRRASAHLACFRARLNTRSPPPSTHPPRRTGGTSSSASLLSTRRRTRRNRRRARGCAAAATRRRSRTRISPARRGRCGTRTSSATCSCAS